MNRSHLLLALGCLWLVGCTAPGGDAVGVTPQDKPAPSATAEAPIDRWDALRPDEVTYQRPPPQIGLSRNGMWILLGHRADCRQHRQRCTIGHARQKSRLRGLAAVAQCCREQEQYVVAERVIVTQALFDALAGIGRRCWKRNCRRRGGCALPLPPHQQHHRDPSLDRPIYQYIQHRADATPCGQPLQMPLAGGRSMAVDIEQYARTFPDSYFDPQRSSEPRDFGGLSLQQRAGNACNSVVYSVLPLGGTDWRCSSLRAQARARVRGLCEDELRRQHGGIGGELDMAVGQGMQGAVVSAIAALPEDFR
jgi:hypothetical protein